MFVTLTIVIFSLIYLNTFDLDHIRFQTTSTHIEILTVERNEIKDLRARELQNDIILARGV